MTHDRRAHQGGTLRLVATPIGNLGDLPPRAVEALTEADLIACEDTRRTSKLLRHAGIRPNRLVIANEHTEHQVIEQVLGSLAEGADVALVSDAGSPGISDPGERLVAAASAAGYPVSAVPGPSAAIMALTISGLPTERFTFEGFLPRKGPDRRARLDEIAAEHKTMVLYEAPHRIRRTLDELIEAVGGERRVAICRELTKVYEHVERSTLGQIDLGEPRGEYVIVLAGRPRTSPTISDQQIAELLTRELDAGVSARDAVRSVAATTGAPKNRVYDVMTHQIR